MLACYLWLFLSPAQAAPVLEVRSNLNALNLTPFVDVLETDQQDLSLADLQTKNWRYRFRPLRTLSYEAPGGQSIWLRFSLKNSSDEPVYLVLKRQPDEFLNSHLFAASTGRELPLQQNQRMLRQVKLYYLTVPPNSSDSWYLNIQQAKGQHISLQLFSLNQLVSYQSARDLIAAICFGALVIITLFNLLTAIGTRESVFLTVTGCSVILMLTQLGSWGYYPQGDAAFAKGPMFSALTCLMMALTLSLAIQFPVYPKAQQRLWKTALQLMLVANLIAAASAPFAEPFVRLQISQTSMLMSLLFVCFVSLIGWLQTHSKLIMHFFTIKGLFLMSFALIMTHYIARLDHVENIATLMLVTSTLEVALISLLVVFRGIANRRKQNQNEQSIALAEAQWRNRSELGAQLAHAIRTPVSNMIGISDLLSNTRLTALQQDYVNTMQRAGRELLDKLEEARQLSNPASAATEIRRLPIDIPELLDEVLAELRHSARAQDKSIVSDISSRLPKHLLGDASRLRQLLLQLLNDALQRSQQRDIGLRLDYKQQLIIDLQYRGHWTTGDRALLNAGEIEHSADTVGRQQKQLRLAVIHQLIRGLNGNISLQIKTDEECSLRARLPLTQLPHGDMAVAIDRPETLKGKCALLLDDNKTFSDFMRRQAEFWQMTLHCCKEFGEAIALLRNEQAAGRKVDVLIADASSLQAEAIDGLKRLQKAADSAAPLPILCFDVTSDSRDIPDDWHIEVLRKPVSGREVGAALSRALSADDSNNINRRPLRCLIAEDDETSGRIILSMLNRMGIDAELVENGQLAVRRMKEEAFDCLIMDYEMPVLDGEQATRQIRDWERELRSQPIPIIGLTARAAEEQRDANMLAGMDAHLIKPVQAEELASTISRWTGRPIQPRPVS